MEIGIKVALLLISPVNQEVVLGDVFQEQTVEF